MNIRSTTMNMIIAALAIFFLSISANAQDGDWKVEFRFNRNIPDVLLHRLANDSLFIELDDRIVGIPLDSIVALRETTGRYGWTGAAIGTGAGGVLGVMAGPEAVGAYPSIGRLVGGILGALLGAGLGAITGSSMTSEEVYDMHVMTREQKRAAVEDILLHD